MERRVFLQGLGGVALAHVLQQEGLLAQEARLPRPPRAKRIVQLFMSGAASQCDTFDYKPALIKRHGAKFDPGGKVELFQSDPGACMKSPWDWKPYGQCGKMISSLVPHIGSCADDIAFIHSMTADSPIHGSAMLMMNSGKFSAAALAWVHGPLTDSAARTKICRALW